MSIYPAISLHQPWATLIATRKTPCACGGTRYIVERENGGFAVPCICTEFVKRFETRSRPCPPKYIGQRVAIHAAKGERWGHSTMLGDFRLYRSGGGPRPRPARMYNRDAGWATRPETPIELPLGAVVATAVITASLPIVTGAPDEPDVDWSVPLIVPDPNDLMLYDALLRDGRAINDQRPYGDWSPGRWAWALSDVEPLDEPVPWKGRQGWFTVELP